MRTTKEQKGLAVLDALMDGRKTWHDLARSTDYPRNKVKIGIEWIRDFAPHALIVQREGRKYFYKLADNDLEVAEHVDVRMQWLYKHALRLERMTAVAFEQWPESKLLRIMHRHLTRLREDVEVLKGGDDDGLPPPGIR